MEPRIANGREEGRVVLRTETAKEEGQGDQRKGCSSRAASSSAAGLREDRMTWRLPLLELL